jgi:hypothetical protein
MNNNEASDWIGLLEELLAATDKREMESKAEELENVLFLRAQEIQRNGGTEVERQGLKEATRKLLKVRVEKLGFPLDPNILGGTGARNRGQTQE